MLCCDVEVSYHILTSWFRRVKFKLEWIFAFRSKSILASRLRWQTKSDFYFDLLSWDTIFNHWCMKNLIIQNFLSWGSISSSLFKKLCSLHVQIYSSKLFITLWYIMSILYPYFQILCKYTYNKKCIHWELLAFLLLWARITGCIFMLQNWPGLRFSSETLHSDKCFCGLMDDRFCIEDYPNITCPELGYQDYLSMGVQISDRISQTYENNLQQIEITSTSTIT